MGYCGFEPKQNCRKKRGLMSQRNECWTEKMAYVHYTNGGRVRTPFGCERICVPVLFYELCDCWQATSPVLSLNSSRMQWLYGSYWDNIKWHVTVSLCWYQLNFQIMKNWVSWRRHCNSAGPLSSIFMRVHLWSTSHFTKSSFIYHTNWKMKLKELECFKYGLKLTYLCNCTHTQTRKLYDDTATESFPGLRKVSETHSGTTRTQARTS